MTRSRHSARQAWSGLQMRTQGWSFRRRVLTSAVAATVLAVGGVAVAAYGFSGDAKPAAATAPPPYLQPMGELIQQQNLPAPALAGETGSAGIPSGTAPIPEPDLAAVPQRSQEIAGYQGGSGTMTPAGIATLALQQGCQPESAIIATAVAMAESGGSPSAQGDIALMDNVWDWSAGLWQIRGLKSQRNTGQLRDSIANQQAAKNAVAMYAISSGCSSWGPWSTYNNGAYQRFLSLAQQAVGYVTGYYSTHGSYPPVAAPDPSYSVPAQGSGQRPAQQPAAVQANGSGQQGGAAPGQQPAAPADGGTAAQPAQPVPAQPGGGQPAATPTTAAPAPVPANTPGVPLPKVSVPSAPLPVPVTSTPTLPKLLPSTPAVPTLLPGVSLPGI